METLTIKDRTFTVTQELPTGDNVRRLAGVTRTVIATGKRGSTCLVQFFGNGYARAIWDTGRSETFKA